MSAEWIPLLMLPVMAVVGATAGYLGKRAGRRRRRP